MDKKAVLVLEDGSVFGGDAYGGSLTVAGEVCFNTAMTGYQEVISDPSYSGQIVCFTFPHVGITGVNDEDEESEEALIRGVVIRSLEQIPSNYRSLAGFDDWLVRKRIPLISGVDTRRLTILLRERGAINGVLCTDQDFVDDIDYLLSQAVACPSLEGADLALAAGDLEQPIDWKNQGSWRGKGEKAIDSCCDKHVVVVDYGCKHNILRILTDFGCRVTRVGSRASAEEILTLNPDGVLLSNGPGDPKATAVHALPTIKRLLEKDLPVFGICLGHQLLAHALGSESKKMKNGHHGANHPIFNKDSKMVKITSQNHGFDIDPRKLVAGMEIKEYSLFDGSIAAIKMKDRPIFGVQYHPEASPGPRESGEFFKLFIQSL